MASLASPVAARAAENATGPVDKETSATGTKEQHESGQPQRRKRALQVQLVICASLCLLTCCVRLTEHQQLHGSAVPAGPEPRPLQAGQGEPFVSAWVKFH